MAYKKTVWIAADGTHHETEKEANDHERVTAIAEVIRVTWNDPAPTPKKIAELLLKHFVIYPKPEAAIEEDA